MPQNKSTLIRLRTIDSCLRRRYKKWTLEDLRQACEDALYDMEGIDYVSKRTTQRDIELMRGDKLGYFAPIVVKDRKYYMYSDPDYSITDMPLTQHDIAELRSAMDIISHFRGFKGMKGAEDILTRLQDRIEQQDEHDQVVFIETNTRLKGLNFLGQLYDHIIRKEPILVCYQSFKSDREHRFHVSPYILKEFNNRWFLICYRSKPAEVLTLALDRMVSVRRDDNGTYIKNTFFNPKTYFDEMVGVTRGVDSPTIQVVLRFDENQAPYVLTKPLHCSQKVMERHEDGSVTISIRVVWNLELERLLIGYAEHLEVISPRQLRQRIRNKFLMAYSAYKTK